MAAHAATRETGMQIDAGRYINGNYIQRSPSLISSSTTCKFNQGWRRRRAPIRYSVKPAASLAYSADQAAPPLSSIAQFPTAISLKELSRRMPGAEELASLQLPPLRCSFPSLLSPHYEEQLKQQCDEWIEAVAQPPSAAARGFLRACLLPRLVCRFIPQALPGPRLLHAIKIIAWLMIADDDDDHPDLLGSDLSATAHHAARVMGILQNNNIGPLQSAGAAVAAHDEHEGRRHGHLSTSSRYSTRLAALAELWQGMLPNMSPSFRSRFISSMADYFDGLKMQAAFRNELCVPHVDSYMEIRRQASFTIPAFMIAEYAMGIELDEVAVADANLVELRNSAVDYISLCNDIYSCYKEITLGDYFNLPSILYTYHRPNIGTQTMTKGTFSFQNVVDNVAQITLDLDARCNSLLATIKAQYSKPTIPLQRAYNVHAYVSAVTLGMAGALAWFHETPRYQKPCSRGQLYEHN